ncbi:MAG: STAS domain-containing protein [Candidatus Omnitrophota bacterium]
MKIEITQTEEGVILSLVGVLKKAEAIEAGDQIAKIARQKPKKLALDCSQLAALSLDSAPFLVSALERARLGKNNVRAFGCNSVVERTLRGADFERVGILE